MNQCGILNTINNSCMIKVIGCAYININCAIKNLLISASFSKCRRANIGPDGERRLQPAMRRIAFFATRQAYVPL